MSNPNHPWCNLRLFPCILSFVSRKKKPGTFLTTTSCQTVGIQLSFLFSRLSNPNFLTCFLYVMLFNFLTSFITIFCICLSNSISFLVVMFLKQTSSKVSKTNKQIQDSSCGLTSITYKGTIISTILLVTFFLMQTRRYWPTWPHEHIAD